MPTTKTILATAVTAAIALAPFARAQAANDPFGEEVRRSMKSTARLLGKDRAKEALRPLVEAYIKAQRAAYFDDGKPLTNAEKDALKKYFPTRLLEKVRVVERDSTGLGNDFAGATTYSDDFIIVKKGRRSNRLLKHEMVHVCQYDKYGVTGFSHKYADQYVDGGFEYAKITFEVEAKTFQKQGKCPIADFLGYCK